MQSPLFVTLLICLALVAVSSAMPFYASADEGVNGRRFPQQGVLENMVNEIMRVQSVEQINNHHVRRQIFSRKFW
ncbi:unnamed protein product [Caenorhabditis sp. 36 PRJEB53466]|nr:unnamed protein product [Caenorhabditis sp. 36 PRJEB53466]